MKKNVLIIFMSLLIMGASCDADFNSDHHRYITIENKSDKPIMVANLGRSYYFRNPEDISCILYDWVMVEENDVYEYTEPFMISIEKTGVNEKNPLEIYIIGTDKYDKSRNGDCSLIESNNNILKYYKFISIEDLKAINFKIVYMGE